MYVHRITDWNALRYDQVYDRNLTIAIMAEELLELIKAKEEVDTLDALVDIVYIAVGAMWKMGLNEDQIYEAIRVVCDSNDSKDAVKTDPSIKANVVKGSNYFRPEPYLQEILDERR